MLTSCPMKEYLKLALFLLVPLGIYLWHTDAFCREESDSPVPVEQEDTVEVVHLNRGPHNVMLLGDSMIEFMCRRLDDYCFSNGHTVHSIVWYSSSTKVWAESDTLEYFMRKYKPDFIMISLGSNEQFVRDLDKRDRYIRQMLEKVGDTPYIWICPPSWKQDTGIDSLILKNVGPKRFFDSRKLVLARGKDHIHPNREAAAQWMDAIAAWLCDSTATAYPLEMYYPDTVAKKRSLTVLQPPK